jgi:hypothetical protein
MGKMMRSAKRAIYRLRRRFTLDGYATAPMWIQLIILLFFSTALVCLFAPLWGSLTKSYLMFVDQSQFVKAKGWFKASLGFIELILGIVVAGFVISILTSTLENFISEIKTGALAYKRGKHVLIVNQNNKLFHILREMNRKFAEMERTQDVVILLKGKKDVEAFWDAYSVEKHQHISVYAKHGVPLFFESFQKVSLLDASAAVILLDKDFHDQYAADNNNLKILSAVLNNNKYCDLLVKRTREKHPLKCTVELNDTNKAKEIAASISTIKGVSTFSVVTPMDMISRILSRSVIDVAYFNMYNEIFSFQGYEIYFDNPNNHSSNGDLVGKSFKELHLGFTKGLLIGFSRLVGNDFQIFLNPVGEILSNDDWLLFLAKDETDIKYEAFTPPISEHNFSEITIRQPSEIVTRRICMIGKYHDLSGADDFLDQESKRGFHENIFVCEKTEDYFDKEKIDQLLGKNFDNVIINLKDEITLRLSLYLLSLYGENADIISRLIIIIENPVTAELLAGSFKKKNIVLSEKLAANFISQITFQKHLTGVIEELTSPEGHEFNLLEIGKEVPSDILPNKAQVKQLLIENEMVYIGNIDRNKNINFDDENFQDSTHLIVLSEGSK